MAKPFLRFAISAADAGTLANASNPVTIPILQPSFIMKEMFLPIGAKGSPERARNCATAFTPD